MYVFERGGLSVRVELDRGAYVFYPDSATGKTYLGKLLEKLCRLDEPVRNYTYTSWCDKVPVPFDKAVLLLDKVDMYPEVLDLLPDRPAGIILLDMKGPQKCVRHVANVEYSTGKVRVFEW